MQSSWRYEQILIVFLHIQFPKSRSETEQAWSCTLLSLLSTRPYFMSGSDLEGLIQKGCISAVSYPSLTCGGTCRLLRPSQIQRTLMSPYGNWVGSLFKLDLQTGVQRHWQLIHLNTQSVSKGFVSFYPLALLLPLSDDINSKTYHKGKTGSDGLNFCWGKSHLLLTYLSSSGNAASYWTTASKEPSPPSSCTSFGQSIGEENLLLLFTRRSALFLCLSFLCLDQNSIFLPFCNSPS